MDAKKIEVKQPLLFGAPAVGPYRHAALTAPIAADADPATSHEAAALVTKSGRRRRNADLVLRILRRQSSPATGHEIWDSASPAEQTELGHYSEIYRRLNDLRHAGLVRQGEARKCRIKKTLMMVWMTTQGPGGGESATAAA